MLFGRTFCDGGGGLEPLLSNRTTIGHTGRTGFCILFKIKLFKFNHITSGYHIGQDSSGWLYNGI